MTAAGREIGGLAVRLTLLLASCALCAACIDEHAALVLFDRPETEVDGGEVTDSQLQPDTAPAETIATDASPTAVADAPDTPPADTDLDGAQDLVETTTDVEPDAWIDLPDAPTVADVQDAMTTELPPDDVVFAPDATATDAGPSADAAKDATAVDLCAAITPCDDGDPCTVGEACAGGVCLPGAPTNCDDGNDCTTDSCDLASGCTATAMPDGLTCTVGVCASGLCKAPPAGMVWIGAGSFVLGCTAGDVACQPAESPTATVSLAGHYLGLREVTAAEYGVCVAGGGCGPPAACGAAVTFIQSVKATHPVNCVTWDQAKAYCIWQGGRLPSEAEWERAARGGKVELLFGWGNQPPGCDPGLPSFAVWAAGGLGCGLDGTWPAQSGLPLGFGLQGMAGNVREWVGDWYAAEAYAQLNGANPQGPSTGSHRVVRGGGFESASPIALRNSARAAEKPTAASVSLGFRCAKDGP